ncbi:penicillin-insensitive murein endopeptidase [Pseudenhygromyxa sp. WMMC2535]|uniref:penicillin-insensitive murein endopeptidase n=1 Tax=Pseudenhygromyxa sp. WMMC2535 TaxID=2712867 RepID=UPI00155323DF|nr:penicillin-insensitive murein endopeptidase [Pseudenhygromyxa sp. WMMC2535]NVB37955.1 penicillin-insensitive murein endopeptidase [Pseudenhygromyxa sp. WMMC2535]
MARSLRSLLVPALASTLGCEVQAAEVQGALERKAASEFTERQVESVQVAAKADTDTDTDAKTETDTTDARASAGHDGSRAKPSWHMPAHEPGSLPRWIEHETIPRETLAQLAARYDVHVDNLRAWNDIAEGDELHPRRPQHLRVYARRSPPPRQRLRHAFREGESWLSISRRYGVDSSDLRAWNVGALGRSLEAGEVLDVWVDPIVYDAIINDLPADLRAAEVRPGAHGVGPPQEGVLIAGVQIPPGPGYTLRYPNSAWGTTWSVRHVVAALDRFRVTSDYPLEIRVGTMSRQRGGEIGGHNSHQTGRDLDIRLPLRVEVPQALPPTARRVDWRATWELVQAFVGTGVIEIIFLDYKRQRRLYKAAVEAGASEEALDALIQYPRGFKANLGLIRHAPGHDGHLHLRFPCGPAESECQ